MTGQPVSGRIPARPGKVVGASVLIALVAVLLLLGPQASVSVFWRLAVLSFDDPTTQALDELALETSPFRDALGDLLDEARLAALVWRRARPTPAGPSAHDALASGRAVRAPPLA